MIFVKLETPMPEPLDIFESVKTHKWYLVPNTASFDIYRFSNRQAVFAWRAEKTNKIKTKKLTESL